MKRIAQVISALALAGTLLPPVLFFAGRMTLEQNQTALLVAAIIWFATAPLWMEHKTTE